MSAIGERLRAERDRLGLNQEAFGALGGVNRNSQANYEKGIRSPDSDYLSAIAAAGVDVMYILTGQRMPRPVEGLSEREAVVLDNFRSLPEEDRASVQRLTNALAESAARDVGAKKGSG